MNWRIILLTGVSASWKTTIQNELLSRWFVRPINFSTRKARGEYELDEYVFVNKNTFARKLLNWDFIEFTSYWWNFYWITNTFTLRKHPLFWKNVCIVVDPVGRAAIAEHLNRIWLPYETYYLHINEDTQKERLLERWDDEFEILKRHRDFWWFHQTNKCIRLDWTKPTKELADFIINRTV